MIVEHLGGQAFLPNVRVCSPTSPMVMTITNAHNIEAAITAALSPFSAPH
jgi:hypothetical protein